MKKPHANQNPVIKKKTKTPYNFPHSDPEAELRIQPIFQKLRPISSLPLRTQLTRPGSPLIRPTTTRVQGLEPEIGGGATIITKALERLPCGVEFDFPLEKRGGGGSG